jgi:hypothetical protein
LYIIGELFGSEARDGVTSAIEHDRAYAANREGLAT